jgi:hypothetical protein
VGAIQSPEIDYINPKAVPLSDMEKKALHLSSQWAGRSVDPVLAGGGKKDAVSAIAADAVSILTEMYPPGHTRLHVVPAKDAENAFASAFERRLRNNGFTLAANDADNTVSVAYILDALPEKGEKKATAWYLRLRLTDGATVRAVARAYTAQGQAEAGQSRIDFDAPEGLLDAAKAKAGKAYDAARDALTE